MIKSLSSSAMAPASQQQLLQREQRAFTVGRSGWPSFTSTPTYALALDMLRGAIADANADDQLAMADLMTELAAHDGLIEQLTDVAEPEQEPFADWHRLRQAIADIESGGSCTLDEIDTKLRKADREAVPSTGVTISTIHKAKGMEWTAVAIIDTSAAGAARSAEEQRVHYVAITRARRHVLIARTTPSPRTGRV